MKYCLFIFFSFFFITCCAAQDTVARRSRLSDSVVEYFYVLKSNPDIKEGPYTVYLNRRTLIINHRTLIVIGNYKNDKKSGVWQYFNVNGVLNEKYNYDKKILNYEAPLYSSADFSYSFDDSLKKGDRLTRPLKIGGIYYGFIPYLNIFKVPFETFDINTNAFEAYIELLISPLGQLADYNVRVVSPYYEYDRIFRMDLSLFSKEDRTFMPATLNGAPVMSRIIIRCYVGPKGDLDFF